VEEPFGTSEDHLDLDGICARIEATVNEILAPDGRRDRS
jgi:predicted membrane chloride channel (bestrophin family)